MRKNGQSLVEIFIIIALVVIAAVVVLTLLGNQTHNLVQTSSDKVGDFQPFDTNKKYSSQIVEKKTIAGYDVSIQRDGTVIANIEGQAVELSPQMLTSAGQVFKTTGAGGTEELIKEIAGVISDQKATYSPEPVPVTVSFGVSETSKGNLTLSGEEVLTAQGGVNALTIQSGDNIVMVQQDQECSKLSGGVYLKCRDTKYDMFQRRIEGTLTSNNTFEGTVSRYNKTTGTYESEMPVTYTTAIDSATNKIVVSGKDPQDKQWELNMTFNKPAQI